MALLTNINGKFSVDTDGAASFNRIGASTTTGFTFPSADGANGEVLKTNGLGTVSWLPDSNTGTVTGTGSATRVAFWSSDSAITSDADLYWDNTNKRLGIGVSSPAALLEINGTGDAIRVESTNTGAGGAQMDLLHYSTSPADNDTMAYINMGGYYNTTPSQAYFSSIRTVATDISARQGELTFWTVNTTLQQRMVIDTDGNVGIGTNTPFGKVDIQYDMDVDTGSIRGLTAGVSQYGNINFSGVLAQGAGAASTSMQGITWQVNKYLGSTNYGNQAQIVVGNNGSIGTFMGFFTSGNYGAAPVEAIRIDSAQNVGIGTDLPSSKLHLRDPGTNSDVGIKIGNDSRDWNLKVMGSVSDSLQFFTHDNSNVMTILPSGSVGIGATSPSSKLHVQSAGSTDVVFKLDNTNVADTAGAQIQLICDSAGSGDGNGALRHSIRSEFSGAINWEIHSGASHGDLNFSCLDSFAMIINSELDVGIGTSSPITKLSVHNSTETTGITDVLTVTCATTALASAGKGAAIRIGREADGNYSTKIATVYEQNNPSYLNPAMVFYTMYNSYLKGSEVERMRITSSGRIKAPSLGGYTPTGSDLRYDTSDGEIYYQTSSKRYKTDIVNLESSLDKINTLRPVRYKDINTGEPNCGLIAEETFEIIPEVVFTKKIEGFDEPQIEGLNYSDLVPFLIKSIQELKAEIEELKLNKCNCKCK